MAMLPISRSIRFFLLAGSMLLPPVPALAADQTQLIKDLQRQIDELKAEVRAMRAAAPAAVPAGQPVATGTASPPAAAAQLAAAAPAPVPATPVPASAHHAEGQKRPKEWYERLQLRGYVQVRQNEQIAGAKDAPPGVSRLRSVHDAGFGDAGNFELRRARLVVQGDVSRLMSVYVQAELAAAVNAQSNGERREHFLQMRDAYADFHFADRQATLRVGQSKVPFGWENLQSSSNRIAIDRADAANSAVPGERDLGAVLYYTPSRVQAIWDRLAADRQKLFGNYGALGFGVFNGQGINRAEKNDGLMKVAMVSWPFRLDRLGTPFAGQVLEIGAQGMLNTVQPELRSGGVSPVAIDERRVNLHAVLYPNPIGFQTEWTWGRGPEWNRATQAITEAPLNGGYVQVMARIAYSSKGLLMPYARWQTYDGGWKAATNAPRVSTREIELGVEWQPAKEVELTVAYVRSRRSEADERRSGIAEGQLIRTQLQFNY